LLDDGTNVGDAGDDLVLDLDLEGVLEAEDDVDGIERVEAQLLERAVGLNLPGFIPWVLVRTSMTLRVSKSGSSVDMCSMVFNERGSPLSK